MPKIYAGTLQNFRQQFFSSLKLHMVDAKLHLSIPTSFSENDPDCMKFVENDIAQWTK